jgi:pimeloyl-ACP methyl ester carboxylesterase
MSKDGPKLPQPTGSPSLPKPKRLGAYVAKLSLQMAYCGLQPTAEEPFAKPPDMPRLQRFYTQTEDGWHLPIYHLPVQSSGVGEPVILAPGLGLNHHSLQYEQQNSLAWCLQRAGFAVFFFSHRGAHGAAPPSEAKAWDFDDIAQRDLPVAIDTILEHTAFNKLHWVGHGLGGQLLYAYLANEGEGRIASASTLCAPVRFESPPSAARAMGFALGLLPAHFELPTRSLGRLFSPALKTDSSWMEQLGSLQGDGATARGLLLHGTENLGAGLLRQLLRWTELGFLSDRSGHQDLAACLEGMHFPLQVLATEGDRSCPPEAAFAVLDFLDGPTDRICLDESWGHRDPLFAPEAKDRVFSKVCAWIERHRELSWAPVVDVVEESSLEKATALR